MARTDTLTNFLTDVANAIRNKKGTTSQISASNFDTEIASIQTSSSSNYNLQSKTVNPSTVTRTYTADAGYYGLKIINAAAAKTRTPTVILSHIGSFCSPLSQWSVSHCLAGSSKALNTPHARMMAKKNTPTPEAT